MCSMATRLVDDDNNQIRMPMEREHISDDNLRCFDCFVWGLAPGASCNDMANQTVTATIIHL